MVTLAGLSVVTTPEHIAADVALLRSAAATPAKDDTHPRDIPLLWKHGSAAVLLHEAAGHALEHGQAPLELPSWLTIDVPLQLRRASFKDVPLMRMTDVVARQSNAPFALPARRIEIVLVDGGSYDPLTDLVTVRVAAAQLVEGDDSRALAPFTIEEQRATIALHLRRAGAASLSGRDLFAEGQELVVGSYHR